MKGFPFRILFVCLLIPPLGYLFSLDLIESFIQKHEEQVVRDLLIQDQPALLDGRYSVQEEIQRNLSRHFRHDKMRAWGVRTRVVVKTHEPQRILYPLPVEEEMAGKGEFGESQDTDLEDRLRYVDLAAENFRILNQGFDVEVDVVVRHNGWLSNGVLVAWVLLAGGLLQSMIRRRTRAAEKERLEREQRIGDLSEQLERASSTLQEVEKKEEDYEQRIQALRKERDGLSQDAESLLEEMDQLEQGAARQKGLREETELEVLELREEIERLQHKLQKTRKKESETDRVRKRLNTLYKNLEFTDRAFEGMADLPADAQLKAEEIIQALDIDASKVPVKRKVFGKGGKSRILETNFAYSGRLYFHWTNGRRVRVVAVGTKNSQTKDLAYLESYRSSEKAG